MGTKGETKFAESSMESLLSSRSLCQAVTQAVTVLQRGETARTDVSWHPELIRSGPRGGLQGPQTDSIPLKREVLWQQAVRPPDVTCLYLSTCSQRPCPTDLGTEPRSCPAWPSGAASAESSPGPDLGLSSATRPPGWLRLVANFLHPSLIRFAWFVFWAAPALGEKPSLITRWNLTAFGILNCFILVTDFALRLNKADVVETQLVCAPSWRAHAGIYTC